MKRLRTPNRRRPSWVMLLVITAGLLWIAMSGGRDLLLGLAMWSVVAIPLVAAGIYLARHDWDVGRFLGGGDPYEGHGPD
jgi:hypothetical protein